MRGTHLPWALRANVEIARYLDEVPYVAPPLQCHLELFRRGTSHF